MIRRLQARVALLRVWLEQTERELDRGFAQALSMPGRALQWLWNAIKSVPGEKVGHGLATVLGLYVLDRWLTRRAVRANLHLADKLDVAGLPDLADELRDSATERGHRNA